jgi:uncharacterized membrane protein YhaH (DUF805 family)
LSDGLGFFLRLCRPHQSREILRVNLLNFVCLMIFMMVVPLSIGSSFHDADPKWAMPLTLALLAGTMAPVLIISTWCFAAMSIKRLHDRNKNGWWMLLFFIAPSLLGKLSDRLDDQTAVFIIGGLGLGLSVWCFAEIFCLKGTKGPNRFGSDPLAKGNISIGAISRATA